MVLEVGRGLMVWEFGEGVGRALEVAFGEAREAWIMAIRHH